MWTEVSGKKQLLALTLLQGRLPGLEPQWSSKGWNVADSEPNYLGAILAAFTVFPVILSARPNYLNPLECTNRELVSNQPKKLKTEAEAPEAHMSDLPALPCPALPCLAHLSSVSTGAL